MSRILENEGGGVSLEPLYQSVALYAAIGLNSGSARTPGGGGSGQYQVFPMQGPPAGQLSHHLIFLSSFS